MNIKKKLFFNFSLLSSVALPLTTISVSCKQNQDQQNQDQNNITVSANEKGLGYYPETIQRLIKGKKNKELIDTINQFINNKEQIKYENNKEYSLNENESTFGYNGLKKEYKCIIALNIKDNSKTKVKKFSINKIGHNNVYHDDIHKFDRLEKVYFWDGQLVIDGYIKDPEVIEKVSSGEVAHEIKNKSFEEQIKIIKKLCKVNIEFHPDSAYDYISDEATHSHPDTLHYVFVRVKKDNPADRSMVSRDIQGFDPNAKVDSGKWLGVYASGGVQVKEDEIDHVVGHNATGDITHKTIGSFVFHPSAKDEGKKMTSKDFLDLLNNVDEEHNHEPKDIINFLKQYVDIDGTYDANDKYEYAFNVEKTHTHGSGALHLYTYYREKGKNQKWVEKSINIVGWGSNFEMGGLKFNNAGIKDAKQANEDPGFYTSPHQILWEMESKSTFDEQLAVLKKYCKVKDESDKNKYDYKFNFKESWDEIQYRHDFEKLSIVKEKTKADDATNTLTITLKIENIFTKETKEYPITITGFWNDGKEYKKGFFDNKVLLKDYISEEEYDFNLKDKFLNRLFNFDKIQDQLEFLKDREIINEAKDFDGANEEFTTFASKDYKYYFDKEKTNNLEKANEDKRTLELVLVRENLKNPSDKKEEIIKIHQFNDPEDRVGALISASGHIKYKKYFTPTKSAKNKKASDLYKELEKNNFEFTSDLTDLMYEWGIYFISNNIKNRNYDDRSHLHLVLEVTEKVTKKTSVMRLDLKNFGAFSKVGDFVIKNTPSVIVNANAKDIINEAKSIWEDTANKDKTSGQKMKLWVDYLKNNELGFPGYDNTVINEDLEYTIDFNKAVVYESGKLELNIKVKNTKTNKEENVYILFCKLCLW